MCIVAIAVPLRDERIGLPKLIDALRRQRAGGWSRIHVHLLFDGLDECDMPLVQKLASNAVFDVPVRFAIHVIARKATPSAGRARRQAVAFALADRTHATPDVLMTTDGDTVPAVDWVATACRALREVDVVAGHISRDNTTVSASRDALEEYLEGLHHLRRTVDPIEYDPAPSHPWVGGANLGFRTAAYGALGGFVSSACGEDQQLVDAARLAGMRVRQARDMRVVTSSRLDGRIAGGLASALTHMSQEVGEPVVEHPADAARQYSRHAWARRLKDNGGAAADFKKFAHEVGGEAGELRKLAESVPNGEAFAMRSVPVVPTTRTLCLSDASRALSNVDPKDCQLGM